jgi:hypothetical protein
MLATKPPLHENCSLAARPYLFTAYKEEEEILKLERNLRALPYGHIKFFGVTEQLVYVFHNLSFMSLKHCNNCFNIHKSRFDP